MKKRFFHIAISVALFCVFTVIYFVALNDRGTVFSVLKRADGSEILFTSGENFECVGEPIEILILPKKVRAGDELSVAFKGVGNTEYSIKVYYPSGLSESETFDMRKSDSKGRVGWNFTVHETAKAGMLRIVVTSENTYFMTEIEIVD